MKVQPVTSMKTRNTKLLIEPLQERLNRNPQVQSRVTLRPDFFFLLFEKILQISPSESNVFTTIPDNQWVTC